MEPTAVARAAMLLLDTRRSGRPLAALDETCRPATIAEGHAIQDLLIASLGEPISGWKVAGIVSGEVMRGAVPASRMVSSPARIEVSSMPLVGVEAEIAFRFEHNLPARMQPYTRDEVAEAVVALPAIEVVETRFQSYRNTPSLHRLGDCMSNGYLVCGPTLPDWRSIDFTTVHVSLARNGSVLAQSVGGHTNGDPLLPAVALANELRDGPGLLAGQVVTTGALNGLHPVAAGDVVTADFEGFSRLDLRFFKGA